MTPQQAKLVDDVLIAIEDWLRSVLHSNDNEDRKLGREGIVVALDEFISAMELDEQ